MLCGKQLFVGACCLLQRVLEAVFSAKVHDIITQNTAMKFLTFIKAALVSISFLYWKYVFIGHLSSRFFPRWHSIRS